MINKSAKSSGKSPLIVGIIQARLGSSRLPGKVLKQIAGKSVLEHIILRVRRSRLISRIVLATTVSEEDKKLIDLAKCCGVDAFAGSVDDVLDRFYQSARKFKADVIVRLCADDPFVDPEVIDRVIGRYLESNGALDFVSNTLKPTYPEGLDVQVFSFTALERAWREGRKPSEREHVTPYIWEHPGIFRLANVENEEDLSSLRWTLDYEADFKLAEAVYRELYREGQVFLMADIVKLLKSRPELASINAATPRYQGYQKSLEADRLMERK